MGREKELHGRVWRRKERFPFFPPPPSPLSFFGSRSFFRATKIENPVLRRSSVFFLLRHHTETLATRTSLSAGGSCYLKSENRCNAALSVNWVDPGYLNITGPSCSKVNSAIYRINYNQNHYNYRNRAKEVKFVQFSGNDNISFSRPGSACYPPDKSLSTG